MACILPAMENDFKATQQCNFEYGKDFAQMYVCWAMQKNSAAIHDINYGYMLYILRKKHKILILFWNQHNEIERVWFADEMVQWLQSGHASLLRSEKTKTTTRSVVGRFHPFALEKNFWSFSHFTNWLRCVFASVICAHNSLPNATERKKRITNSIKDERNV